ncbi:MAG: ABC transporter ATP-binding protein [Pirellulales bacterium]|nr:ABC transporter ATP-binding protein [Pirellulales bacterium]
MIEFDQAKRNYGRKTAVNDLTLMVPGGELFALLGPNGAGKTTSIKMLVGLLRPSSGIVRICGYDVVKETRQANRCLGYVPDQPYLYDKLSGREFLQFIADLYGLGREESATRIAREIRNFELTEFVDQLTESYSHGMKQRTVFAAALLHDPAVLVLDEPMVGLDPRSMRLVKDLLRDRASAGMTIFMSTHTLGLAEEIADRIGIVDRGRLRFIGTGAQLRQQLAQADTSLERMYLELTTSAEAAAAQETA